MSQLIHITLNNQSFDIPKDILERFDFFKGMLEIESNNLSIDNPEISADDFKVFIMMICNKDICKDITILYDMLGYNDEHRYKLISSYYCTRQDCTKIKLDKSIYCAIHEANCRISKCENDKYKSSQYCLDHKCLVDDCLDYRFDDYNYCDNHNICSADDCKYNREPGNKSCVGYCYRESCFKEGCYNRVSLFSLYCSSH